MVKKSTRLQEDIMLTSNLASHDLKAPLSIILTYCNALENELINKPLSKEKEWVTIIHTQTDRMREMVSTLFEYLSIEISSDKEKQLINCDQALATVLNNLTLLGQAQGAQITSDPLPPIMGRNNQIATVFACLVDNAIKFVKPGITPIIHISSKIKKNMVEFTIKDNGIGIDAVYHEFVFILFKKLDLAEKYSGLGVGLALCKKIIECSGGNIWLKSQPDNGSIFCFSLPRVLS